MNTKFTTRLEAGQPRINPAIKADALELAKCGKIDDSRIDVEGDGWEEPMRQFCAVCDHRDVPCIDCLADMIRSAEWDDESKTHLIDLGFTAEEVAA